jgi:hypothetical protein
LGEGIVPSDRDQWYVKSGLRRKWALFGATIVYVDYILVPVVANALRNDLAQLDVQVLGHTRGVLACDRTF